MTQMTIEDAAMTEPEPIDGIEILPAPAANIAAKTICLSIQKRSFGNSRKASMSVVTVEADKALLRLTKTLLDSPELVAIGKHDSKVANAIEKVSFPSNFKAGVYLVSVTRVTETNENLKTWQAEREVLVNRACEMYAQRCEETAARLNVVAASGDYPSVEVFRSKFGFEWNWVAFETPTKLKAINADIFEQEKQKAVIQLTMVADNVQQAIRKQLSDMFDHLADRLTPGADGKPKRLMKSATGNIQEWLKSFEDITGDADFAPIIAKARSVMEGVDPQTLKDDLVRTKVLNEISELAAALDPLVVDKADRAISFTDGDE
jgi:hypothetical protein